MHSSHVHVYNCLLLHLRRPAWLDSPNGLDGGGSVDAAMARASRDEFWAAIQPDYNYLMGRQLIDSCCQSSKL
ncbi:hypothetical protein B566_EDAN015559 [Ephemera danica]|nr:hypothetical protein B566_EDAN015559 [Ephemera danica]